MYKALATPRIIWATQDLSTYGNKNANIYVSKNISSQIEKDSKPMKSQSFELNGSITDIRTFFNDSTNKSFVLITNGSNIFKFPISFEDETTEEIAKNQDKNDLVSNNFERFNTLASSFRYMKYV